MQTLKPERPVAGIHHTRESCDRKKRFSTEDRAWGALLNARRYGHDADRTQQPYRCTWCCGWHLGHRLGAKKMENQDG